MLMVVLLFGVVSCAYPPPPAPAPGPQRGPDVLTRIDNQQRRIDQGVSSGQLTRNEAAILQDNLNWIKQRYTKMASDGVIGPKDSAKLENMLDENDSMIYEKRHNIRRLY
ncbi:MAG: hypothetical protein ACLGPL_02390 [Acidobacteriota bacterium]